MRQHFQSRFVERIEALARLSESPDYLVRPSFTPSMKRANALVGDWMRAAGMSVREDAVGNLIGRYEGTTPDAKAVLIGSHIDTVIDAGKYDGTLGVLLGLACVEELAVQGKRLQAAIEVIAFCDEEGLRYKLSFVGSRALAGVLSHEHLELEDADGVPLKRAMVDYGGLPPFAPEGRNPSGLIGYLEAHIEQGPVLESAGVPVGIVSGIQGLNRFEVVFSGEAGHAGTVPMPLRRDALVAAARFIVAVQETARATEGLVATVGQIQALPGASNAIPGRAVLSLDLRHMEEATRRSAIASISAQATEIAERERVGLRWTEITDTAATPCSPQIMEALSASARALGVPTKTLASGAGHDAVMISRIAPVGMLFVRCKDGISHNPAEYCSPVDAETAADVILGAIEALSLP